MINKEFKNITNSKYKKSWNPSSLAEAKKAVASATSEEDFEKTGIQFVEKLQKYLKKDFEILDYGCGIGRMAKPMSEIVNQIHCIDISKKMLEFAKEYCSDKSNIKFMQTNGSIISLDDNTIDFAYSVLVLQHMEKEDAFLILKEMYRVLKKGAKVYFSLPNFVNKQNLETFEKFAHQGEKRVPHRMRMYTANEIKTILNYLGYKIESEDMLKTEKPNFEIIAVKN